MKYDPAQAHLRGLLSTIEDVLRLLDPEAVRSPAIAHARYLLETQANAARRYGLPDDARSRQEGGRR